MTYTIRTELGTYEWVAASRTADDGDAVIKPDAVGAGDAGRWVRAGGKPHARLDGKREEPELPEHVRAVTRIIDAIEARQRRHTRRP